MHSYNLLAKQIRPALLAPVTALLLLFFLGVGFDVKALPLGPHQVVEQINVRTKMRDGVQLVADIYRPRTEGKFPILLERTPYNRKGDSTNAYALASYGYGVILQDTRGRFDSEGEFYPFKYESLDGYDTVEWASGLEFANGQVGMFGGSYVGATQMLAAMVRPPHLTAIFPYVTASEYYEGWTYQGGALAQWFTSSWSSGLVIDTLRRKADQNQRPKEWIGTLPLEDYILARPPQTAELAPYFRDWVTHERDDDYWKPWKVSDHYGEMAVKALHGGGWHDLFLKGSIKNYLGLRDSAATPEARANQRLLLGPWAHAGTSPEGKIGDVVFGKEAVLDTPKTILDWFDYSLKGTRNEFASDAPVRIFVMGDNVWRSEKEFPLARTQYAKYFLHSVKGANGIKGDGVLNVTSPGNEKADSFTYDPANPVPTIGGRLCCGAAIPPGPANQQPNESRSDVLVFSTPRLERDLEVTGFISLDLYASSSAVDTDFTALLVDLDQSGYARFLTDGIVRARYRNTTTKAEPIAPEQVYKYSIDLWATSNVFKAGHQLRLYISSSNFPRFNRNLNTGETTLGATRMVSANQTIYHDRQHPSAITLPIIPK
jgi:putative CocE/NonD family hydrolase